MKEKTLHNKTEIDVIIHGTHPCSHISTKSADARVVGGMVFISRRAEIGKNKIISATAA